MRRKIALLTVAAAMFTTVAQAQLLYKISGNGLEKPSYIVGTSHMASAQFANKIKGISQAINETDQVYGEVDTDSMVMTTVKRRIERASSLPYGKTLRDVLTGPQYARVNNTLRELLGAGFENPEVNSRMGKLTPGALATQISTLMYLQAHMGEFDPMNLIDDYFQKVAKHNGEPVGALETIDFQISLLYTSTSMERQIEQLMCVINNRNFIVECMEAANEAYHDEDLAGVKAAMDERIGNSCDSTPEEEARLIYDRNIAWCAAMPAIMASKPTLFAVGAGHLPGDKGVLALLKAAGYTVEAVTE